MLAVTEAAVEGLSTMLEQRDAGRDQGLRLVEQGEGQLTLSVDSAREGDQVIAQGDRPVLFVEETLSNALDGATLDAVDTPEGTRLTLVPPGQIDSAQPR